jgi:hypothetical protein
MSTLASRDDLRRILGDLDDPRIMDILALQPSVAGQADMRLFQVGDSDVLAKGGHPVSGTAVRIAEILAEEEEEDVPSKPLE